MDVTDGRGPDRCIDAVGTEAHGAGAMSIADRVKQGVGLEDDRPTLLRAVVQSCRKGGTISILGVYTGMADKIPIGG